MGFTYFIGPSIITAYSLSTVLGLPPASGPAIKEDLCWQSQEIEIFFGDKGAEASVETLNLPILFP